MSALRLDDPGKVAARFWPKVHKLPGDGCWLWTAAKKSGGYGVIGVSGATALAHRVAFALEHGECPDSILCHKCNTPSCVRPSHVYPGTHLDNARDRVAASGRTGGLTIESAWHDALIEAARGISQRDFAERLGVSQQTVSKYLSGVILPGVEAALNAEQQLGIPIRLLFEAPLNRVSGRRHRVRSDKGEPRKRAA